MIDSILGYEMVVDGYNELCVHSTDFLYNYEISSFDRSELTGSFIMLQKNIRLFLVDSFLTDDDIQHLYLMVGYEIEYLMELSLDLSPYGSMCKDILLELIIFFRDIIEISNRYDQYEISNNMKKLMMVILNENYYRININQKYD